MTKADDEVWNTQSYYLLFF